MALGVPLDVVHFPLVEVVLVKDQVIDVEPPSEAEKRNTNYELPLS